MTQPDAPQRNEYPANGSTIEFVFEFKIANTSEVRVSLIEVVDGVITEILQVLDTDYDVSGVGVDGGGTVTFNVAPVEPFTILLQLEVPFDQQKPFKRGTAFPSITIENAYDKLTKLAQINRMNIKLALKPPNVPGFTDGTLSINENGFLPLNIVQINETGDGFTSNPLQAVFGLGPITSHQVTQLGQIGETTFISAGEWAIVGDLNQGLTISSNVTFASVNGATNLSDIADLTTDEIDQLKNIDTTIITISNWSHLSSFDQDLGTTDSPTFQSITVNGQPVGETIIHAAQNFNTGAIQNGNLSIASATTFSLSGGSGLVVDYSTDVLMPDVTEVSWSAFISITLLNMGTGTFKFIGIDSIGDLVQSSTKFTELELRDIIPIGLIVHTPTDITFVLDETRKSIGTTDALTDLLTTIGTLNRSGNVYSPNGANLSVDKTTGETFGQSLNVFNSEKFANITTDSGMVLADFTPIFRDGSGGFSFGALTNVIDVANYDDGSGVLQSLGVNEATNHRLAFDAVTGFSFMLYGQTLYANLSAAIDAVPDPFDVINPVTSPITVRSIVSARGGATDLTDPSHAILTEVSMFNSTAGGSTAIQAASLQTAYEQSPDTILDAATPISVQVDTDTDKVVSYKDSGGTEKYSVDGLGNINTTGIDTVTGNDPQGSTPLRLTQDFNLVPIQTILEDKTLFDKPVDIVSNDDDTVPLDLTASSSPNQFLIRIRSNSLEPIFSIDNAGQILANGKELESGPGEVILGYESLSQTNRRTHFAISLPAFDDPLISGIRIEAMGMRYAVAGDERNNVNRPGMQFITEEQVTTSPLTNSSNYFGVNVTNGTRFNHELTGAPNYINCGGANALPPFGQDLSEFSFVATIPTIPEFLKDQMVIHISGSASNQFVDTIIPITEIQPNYVWHATEVIQHQTSPLPAESQELFHVTKLIFRTHPSGFSMGQGTFKIIGIKRGGPPIPQT